MWLIGAAFQPGAGGLTQSRPIGQGETRARFTAEITSGTGAYATLQGLVPMVVVDNGEPSVNDTATWLDLSDNNHLCPLGPLTAGNIQVHFNS